MTTTMRETTLQTMGLGNVIDFFSAGQLPVDAGDLVDQVFGNSGSRGALVVSGANGIVGAGKTMQLGSRLAPYDIPIVGLDFPAAPDGIGKQYPGLVRAFGADDAAKIMGNVIRLNYDGKTAESSVSPRGDSGNTEHQAGALRDLPHVFPRDRDPFCHVWISDEGAGCWCSSPSVPSRDQQNVGDR